MDDSDDTGSKLTMKHVLIGSLVILTLMPMACCGAWIVVVRLAGSSDESTTQTKSRTPKSSTMPDHSGAATRYCEALARKNLKQPHTADFPWSARAKNTGLDTYRYQSYVDAKNAFGATIRTPIDCKVEGAPGHSQSSTSA